MEEIDVLKINGDDDDGHYCFHSDYKRSWRCILVTLLLLLSGRVPHPGPVCDNGGISLHYLNINSMVRKGPLLRDLIEERKGDVFVITETKLLAEDTDFVRHGSLLEFSKTARGILMEEPSQ